MDFSKKIKAIKLRREGKSYAEIKKIVPASKSTLSNWLKDIELTKEQKSRLSKLQATGYQGAKTNQTKSLNHHRQIRLKAENEAVDLIRNPFFVAGLMLYWAEGSKGFGSVQFSNSDSAMVRLMMRWFREFCEVPEQKFRIGLFLHSLHINKDVQDFWQDITGLPSNQFQKPYIKPTIFSNRKNKLYEGTCMIKIHSRDLFSRIMGWKTGAEKEFLNNGHV